MGCKFSFILKPHKSLKCRDKNIFVNCEEGRFQNLVTRDFILKNKWFVALFFAKNMKKCLEWKTWSNCIPSLIFVHVARIKSRKKMFSLKLSSCTEWHFVDVDVDVIAVVVVAVVVFSGLVQMLFTFTIYIIWHFIQCSALMSKWMNQELILENLFLFVDAKFFIFFHSIERTTQLMGCKQSSLTPSKHKVS